ncbi:MAG: type I-G CRISPR-associated protein Csb2 [Longimicrobiales bacterium]
MLSLKAPLTDVVAEAWKAANPSGSFAAVIDQLRKLASAPEHNGMTDVDSDEILLSRLARLLHALSETPTIWLPRTSGGHTRQYFPIHEGGLVKNTGSAVFDTFAAVRKDQPVCFHWPELQLNEQQHADLRLLLSRMTYFGRAESWCRSEAYSCQPEEIRSEGIARIIANETHWECVCIEDGERPAGREYYDYLLERRLAPVTVLSSEVVELLPRTNTPDGKKRKPDEAVSLRNILQAELQESPGKALLRCLLRESGKDIKDGLDRPIGTRWIHYAVPRAIYDLPRPKRQLRVRATESVDLVCYALNTTTVNRPVLPALTDTLLVADKFRSAGMALCRGPSRALSGHEKDGLPCKDHQHAHWWPFDEDNDGFIDHVTVWAPGGFEQHDVDALRRLTRLTQRGGRPDLLVTPMYVGLASEHKPWQGNGARTFVSATPYFCPVHLSHGRKSSGRIRSLSAVLVKSLRLQGTIHADDDVAAIEEIVFDYAPRELVAAIRALAAHQATEPLAPRQFFPVIEPPDHYPPLSRPWINGDARYAGATVKDPDDGYCFGTSTGLLVDAGARFVPALSFCRRRRGHEVRGRARMLKVSFNQAILPRPFSIGAQCHFGMGLFVPSR